MLNLVYDSMFLLRELCHCVSSVSVSLIGFVLDKCSFVVAFVDGLFIYGCIFFTVRCTFRMSTRRLYVILFVLLFTVTVISYLLLRDVLSGLQVAEEFLFLSARRRAYIITTFHSLFINILLSQPP